MNFRDEYKKEISEISPDEAALERIRSGVAKRLAEPEVTKKKPLPLRRIAVIGGSAAACLVIGVTAVLLTHGGKFSMDGTMNMMSGGAAPTAGSSFNGVTGANGNAVNANQFIAGGSDMSGKPSSDDVNTDYGDGMYAEGITGAGEAVGDYPALNTPTEQEPSSAQPARITLDGDTLTLEYNGETTVYTAIPDSSIDNGKGNEDNIILSEADETERIEALLNGEIMFVTIKENKLLLFNSENAYKSTFVKSE